MTSWSGAGVNTLDKCKKNALHITNVMTIQRTNAQDQYLHHRSASTVEKSTFVNKKCEKNNKANEEQNPGIANIEKFRFS